MSQHRVFISEMIQMSSMLEYYWFGNRRPSSL